MAGKAEREWLEEEVAFALGVAEKVHEALKTGRAEEVNSIMNEAVIARLRGDWRVVEDNWRNVGRLSKREQRLWKRLRELLSVLDKAVIYFWVGKEDDALEVLDKYLVK